MLSVSPVLVHRAYVLEQLLHTVLHIVGQRLDVTWGPGLLKMSVCLGNDPVAACTLMVFSVDR